MCNLLVDIVILKKLQIRCQSIPIRQTCEGWAEPDNLRGVLSLETLLPTDYADQRLLQAQLTSHTFRMTLKTLSNILAPLS